MNAIAAHHEEVKAETILAPLVDAADALSGARPGARREVLESYAKRLEDLEQISNSFKGVERSFAVQAGREIRVIVDPGTVPDDQAVDAGARRRPADRAGDDLSRADQGDRHPGDARERDRALTDAARCFSATSSAGPDGARAGGRPPAAAARGGRSTSSIANGENASGGKGINPRGAEELRDAGVDVLTSGNHIWQSRDIIPYLHENQRPPAAAELRARRTR